MPAGGGLPALAERERDALSQGRPGAARREHGFFLREKKHVWERKPATFSNKPTPNLPGRNRLCCLYGGE